MEGKKRAMSLTQPYLRTWGYNKGISSEHFAGHEDAKSSSESLDITQEVESVPKVFTIQTLHQLFQGPLDLSPKAISKRVHIQSLDS